MIPAWEAIILLIVWENPQILFEHNIENEDKWNNKTTVG